MFDQIKKKSNGNLSFKNLDKKSIGKSMVDYSNNNNFVDNLLIISSFKIILIFFNNFKVKNTIDRYLKLGITIFILSKHQYQN